MLIPFLLVIGALVRVDSRGPALFRQDRTGLNGETFVIYKFRTMTVMEDGESARQATVGDARVSSIGRILRKLSIDELPQLYNVMLGDMSLVGPRPHPPSLDKAFAPKICNYMGRYLAKPGITGLAQVEGARGETSTIEAMQRRVDFDIDYVTRASFSLDIAIIFRTVFVLVFRSNAF
jgi:lipopolysaccharide/colanic/teichoic acid biosynthesis glycosyltransferase